MMLRLAAIDDVPELTALIAASVRILQAPDYTESQREGALASVYGVDTQLIEDRTYFVAEVEGTIVACGGWSKRKTLFGADHCAGREDSLLDPSTDAAKIRAFFVHPNWSRRGIGTKVLEACESAALSISCARRDTCCKATSRTWACSANARRAARAAFRIIPTIERPAPKTRSPAVGPRADRTRGAGAGIVDEAGLQSTTRRRGRWTSTSPTSTS